MPSSAVRLAPYISKSFVAATQLGRVRAGKLLHAAKICKSEFGAGGCSREGHRRPTANIDGRRQTLGISAVRMASPEEQRCSGVLRWDPHTASALHRA